MLVPLETLPGWPQAASPSVLEVLGLLVGLPLVVVVIVGAIAKVDKMIKVSRGEPLQVTEPVWVGGLDRPEIEGPLHDEVVEDAKQVSGPGTDVGGASARW